MTVITKPLSEKKLEKPLVHGSLGHSHVIENGEVSIVHDKRASSATAACLFLTALLITTCGILTGICLYRQYAKAQVQRLYNWCSIPYETEMREDIQPYSNHLTQNYFREDFEIDETSVKISVPTFEGNRKSKFVHDFHSNLTGIVDVEGERCFVIPLNRSVIMKPKSFKELVSKLQNGYYDVDTTRLRETMRVVTPAIEDRSSLGPYIQTECIRFPVYRLEKIVSGVYKRSVQDDARFIEFAGRTVELNIVNYHDLAEAEAQLPVAMA